MSYCRENMGYDSDPDVHYVTDRSNANSMLGTTAHYRPDNRVVTVYISNRHPKDVLRSLAHELVHHAQNLRGDLQNVQTEEGYAQKDPHMRKMEEEAYLTGNMMFRDWEDSCKENNTLNLNLPSTIGENKMSDQLNRLVAEKVIAQLNEQGVEIDEGFLDRLMAKGKGKVAGLSSRIKGAAAGFKGEPVPGGEPQAAEAEAMFKSRIPKASKQIEKIVADVVGDLDKLGLSSDERVKNVIGRLKGVQTSFAKVAKELVPAVQNAAQDAPEEETDEDGEPRSFRFDPAAFNPLREDEELEEEKKKKGKFDDGDGKDEKCDYVDCDDEGKKDVEEGRRTYGSRPKGDKPHNLSKDKLGSFGKDHEDKVDAAADKKHKEELAAARARLKANPDSYTVKENELAEIKKGQDSIKNLNEQRNQKLNDELMRRLLK